MDRPNVLLVIWDACRLDMANDNAPSLETLASDNLYFENAIAPAGQSLGSHVSMLTGEYPHEHGIYRQTDFIESPLPLVADLKEKGYQMYAVSANGFASPRYGFDRGFDEFYNTQGVTAFPEGLDLHKQAREIRERNDGVLSIDFKDRLRILTEAVTHGYPFKSLANIGTAAISELSRGYRPLQLIPHPRFNRFNEFCYSPERNTRLISSILDRMADTQRPFFLVTNYMDAHHPYTPPEVYQLEYCGRQFSYRELSDLSEESHPWSFLERLATEGPPRGDFLETIRGLYRGEVRSLDDHLARLLTKLDRTGLREETLIVIVADHGENLGEVDRMGERHMGHVRSASDHHLRIPLVIAHPRLRGRFIEEYVSVKDLHGLISSGLDEFLSSKGDSIPSLVSGADVAAAEIPTTTTTELTDKYPSLRDLLEREISVVYGRDWKVVLTSDGTEFTEHYSGENSVQGVPGHLYELAQQNLEELIKSDTENRQLSEDERAHLEALGYL